MWLRCLAGRHAGEIRFYALPVALAALKVGSAARVDVPASPAPPIATRRKIKRRTE